MHLKNDYIHSSALMGILPSILAATERNETLKGNALREVLTAIARRREDGLIGKTDTDALYLPQLIIDRLLAAAEKNAK